MFDQTAAVILAAGLGTRMRSERPKLLHEALGQPLIHYPVSLTQALGVARCVVVVGKEENGLKPYIQSVEPSAEFAVQAQQLGTANAVLAARDATVGFKRVLILSGDVPGLTTETVEQMGRSFESDGGPLVLLSFEPADSAGYGRIVGDGTGRAARIVEHRDATEAERDIASCNSGVYLVDRDFLFDAVQNVGAGNEQKEFYLTDIVAMAAAQGHPASIVECGDSAEVAGVNDRSDLAEVTRHLRMRKLAELLVDGVTLLDPNRTWIDQSVGVAPDAVIHPDVMLTGATSIGRGTTVGQGAVITNSEVGVGAIIRPYCVITDSRVGNNTAVGPFAHLRPGTELQQGSKVGNFVEIKKTVIGPGSKANHLSYLGDTEIGKNVNVGAGTITCNYDGVGKHKTHIDDGAFIGSNTALVAPVTVGKDALVAAGSTITEDVPPGALGVARQRQNNIDGWAAKNGPSTRKRKD